MSQKLEAAILEDFKRLQSKFEKAQSTGVIGNADVDPVCQAVGDIIREVRERLESLPDYKKREDLLRFFLPFKQEKIRVRTLKRLSTHIKDADDRLLTTERRRGFSEQIGGFRTTNILPGGVHIDSSFYYCGIASVLRAAAESGLKTYHFVAEIVTPFKDTNGIRSLAVRRSNREEKWEALKADALSITGMIISVMERLVTFPFFADEYEELLRQIHVASQILWAVCHTTHGIDTRGFDKETSRSSDTIEKLKNKLDMILKDQDERVSKFHHQYKDLASGAFATSEPDALVRDLVEKADVLPVDMEMVGPPKPLTDTPSGYGTVYRVELTDGSKVAVKAFKKGSTMTNGQLCRRIIREAAVYSATQRTSQSDKLVRFRGFWKDFPDERWPCLVMDWYDENLTSYLEHSECPQKKVKLMLDVAQGLLFLHNLNPQIVHGDLKSDNILVQGGSAIIADFGISRIIDNLEEFRTNANSGSKPYWSPELVLSLNMVDFLNPTTDVYAFGMLFLHVMINTSPFAWLPEKEQSDAFKRGLTPYDAPPPNAPPKDLGLAWSPFGLPTKADVPHPKSTDSQGNDYSPSKEHWEFMKLCWSRNPWKRPTAADVVAKMEEFVNAF